MLLPVSALPSRYGIGCFSREAYHFVDQLKEAGQQYWQILPLGPTGYGDSPYQSFSAFAGNPYLIDLEDLIQKGLLTREECDQADFGDNPRDIDYEKLYRNRFPVLRRAFERWRERQFQAGYDEKQMEHIFSKKLSDETLEYCFYMAVKNEFGGKSWSEWDEDIRLRKESAVRHYREKLQNEILLLFLFTVCISEAVEAAEAVCQQPGILIIGDIPIYVAFDGADSWAHS